MLIHILPQATIVPVTTTNRYHSLVGCERVIVVYSSTSSLQTLTIGTTANIVVEHCNGVNIDIAGIIVNIILVELISRVFGETRSGSHRCQGNHQYSDISFHNFKRLELNTNT